MTKLDRARALLAILFVTTALCGQVPTAREAMNAGDYVRASRILAELVATEPSADNFLDLGVVYATLGERDKAINAFEQGITRHPQDARLHAHLAAVHIGARDTAAARIELDRALAIDPKYDYAADMRLAIELSESTFKQTLDAMNRHGRPVTRDVLHNGNAGFANWIASRALPFKPGDLLKYNEWRTAQERLLASGVYSSVSLDVLPTAADERYDADLRATPRTTSVSSLLFGAATGLVLQPLSLHLWNIGNTAVHAQPSYRWRTNRRKADGAVHFSLPLPGLVFVEAGMLWRQERWDVSRSIRPEHAARARFDYKSTALRLELSHIPHWRVRIFGGADFNNQAARGDLMALALDGKNFGKLRGGFQLKLADGRVRSAVRPEGFASRQSILGDFDFTGGSISLRNRVDLERSGRTRIDVDLSAGTIRGRVPLAQYFQLGSDFEGSAFPMRASPLAARDGHPGRSPLATDFGLTNLTLSRRLFMLPLFNTLGFPSVDVRAEGFLDSARTFDRQRVFRTAWHQNAGVSLRLDAGAQAVIVSIGRRFRGPDVGGAFTILSQRRW